MIKTTPTHPILTREATFMRKSGNNFIFVDDEKQTHILSPYYVSEELRNRLKAGDDVIVEYWREPGRTFWRAV